jgi:hypothetical protein
MTIHQEPVIPTVDTGDQREVRQDDLWTVGLRSAKVGKEGEKDIHTGFFLLLFV